MLVDGYGHPAGIISESGVKSRSDVKSRSVSNKTDQAGDA